MFQRALSPLPGSGGGGFNFSTDEQKTGLKWIDGKDIYAKTYTATSINPKTLRFTLPTGYKNIIDWTAIVDIQGGNNNINNIYYAGTNPVQYLATWTESGEFRMGSNWSNASSAHITIYYTKS